MSENLNAFTRWDADHVASIAIQKNDHLEEELKDDLRYCCFNFLTKDKEVADLFGVELFDGSLYSVQEKNNHNRNVCTFALGFDEDDGFELAYSCFDLEDSALVGLFLVEKEAWLNAYPAYDFNEDDVYDIVLETLVAKVNQLHDSRCYAAVIDAFGRGDCGCVREGYASPKEALEDAMDEFSDIKFEESDFEVIHGEYKLKAN